MSAAGGLSDSERDWLETVISRSEAEITANLFAPPEALFVLAKREALLQLEQVAGYTASADQRAAFEIPGSLMAQARHLLAEERLREKVAREAVRGMEIHMVLTAGSDWLRAVEFRDGTVAAGASRPPAA